MTDCVITMAGLGSRFRKKGYSCPKYMIEVRGKTLFEWSVESVVKAIDGKYVFIALSSDDALSFIKERCDAMGIMDFSILELESLTSGQAETAMIAMREVNIDSPVAIFNIDTHIVGGFTPCVPKHCDGFIPCFRVDGDHWSFVKVKPDSNQAIEVREKQRISPFATIGYYWFKSAHLYKSLYDAYYGKDGALNFEKGEAYIAPMYNRMIESGMRVEIALIPTANVKALGTPEEVETFRSQR